jgi:TonB family protein
MNRVMARFLIISLTLHVIAIAMWNPSIHLIQPSSTSIHVTLHKLTTGKSFESQNNVHAANVHESPNIEPSLKQRQERLKKSSEQRVLVHKAGITGGNQDNHLPVRKNKAPLSGTTATSYNLAKPTTINRKSFTEVENWSSEKTSVTGDTPLRRDESLVKQKTKIVDYLQQQLAQYFSYPFIARKRGWQGTVLLQFRIESNGYIKDIRIQKSSGYSILDRSAVKSLRRVGRIPITDWLDNNTVTDLELPVEFKFNKG